MATKYGINARLYYNTGSYGSPTWVVINDIKDLSLGLPKEDGDATTRGSGGWKAHGSALKDASVEFKLQKKVTSQATLTALRNAYLNSTQIELLVLDGDIGTSGSEGLRATCEIFDCSRDESMANPITYNIKALPADADNPPSWYTV